MQTFLLCSGTTRNHSHGLDLPHHQSHHGALTDIAYIDRVGRQKYPIALGPEYISMIIVPSSGHAQAQYLTCAAYRNLHKDTIDNVIIIAQSDLLEFHGVALPLHEISAHACDNFTLNKIHIDQLIQQSLFHFHELAYQLTDVFQVQMQFMQHYLNDNIKITPLLVGHISHENASDIAYQISQLCDERTLIVISADMTSDQDFVHYGSGFINLQTSMYHHDAKTIQAIQGIPLQACDVDDSCLYHKNALIILLELLKQDQCKNIQSCCIGYDTCVEKLDSSYQDCIESYAAFVFSQRLQGGYKNCIGLYEQSQLLGVAQNSLQNIFEPVLFEKPYMVSYEMMQPYGVFVSLYSMTDHGMLLRGCMGHMESKASLYELVYEMTKHAACHDDRFYALMHQEVKSTLVSLSIITDLYQVKNFKEICRADGIWFTYYHKSAISLPSDHPIHDWSPQEMLSDLCFQVGVPLFTWKKPAAQIFKFQAITFQEM